MANWKFRNWKSFYPTIDEIKSLSTKRKSYKERGRCYYIQSIFVYFFPVSCLLPVSILNKYKMSPTLRKPIYKNAVSVLNELRSRMLTNSPFHNVRWHFSNFPTSYCSKAAFDLKNTVLNGMYYMKGYAFAVFIHKLFSNWTMGWKWLFLRKIKVNAVS